MLRALRRLGRRPGRLLRPAVALVLVLAHCAATFGFPVVVRRGESLRPCGCKASGPSSSCCCRADGCCAATPAPEPPSCPKCVVKSKPAANAEPSATVGWAVGVAAGQCRGESPLGLAADVPSVPPVVSPQTNPAPEPAGVMSPANQLATLLPSVPDDPPPRR